MPNATSSGTAAGPVSEKTPPAEQLTTNEPMKTARRHAETEEQHERNGDAGGRAISVSHSRGE